VKIASNGYTEWVPKKDFVTEYNEGREEDEFGKTPYKGFGNYGGCDKSPIMNYDF
jgi:hypothetical protein